LSSGQTLIGDISKTAIKKASCPRNKMTIWKTTLKPKLTFAIFLFFKNNVLTDEFIFLWFVRQKSFCRKSKSWSKIWWLITLSTVPIAFWHTTYGVLLLLGQVRKFFKFEFLSRKHFW
jgi:hypothetical protein